MWLFSGFLTAINAFPYDDPARTDTKLDIIEKAAWFRIPYPCMIFLNNTIIKETS